MCGPVFQSFMSKAIEKHGGGKFQVPEGGQFIKIDRFSGARLPPSASGAYVVAEFFREGEEPLFGYVFDGGFAMGKDLELFEGEQLYYEDGTPVVNSTDPTAGGEQSSFGSLSSGGLY